MTPNLHKQTRNTYTFTDIYILTLYIDTYIHTHTYIRIHTYIRYTYTHTLLLFKGLQVDWTLKVAHEKSSQS
jgi:hypothetical protein